MLRQNPPSVTYPSPSEWPNTIVALTNISNSPVAKVTAPLHGFTTLDIAITTVMFQQVLGMIQINGLPGTIQAIIDANNFLVNIDTSNFFPYASGGIANNLTGAPPLPPVQTQGFQTGNTPFQNIA